MTKNYNRSEVYSYSELSADQQKTLLGLYDTEILQDANFVLDAEGEALPLFNFMRTNNNKFTHGVYGLSAFSCYTATFSKCGSMATVAYKYF